MSTGTYSITEKERLAQLKKFKSQKRKHEPFGLGTIQILSLGEQFHNQLKTQDLEVVDDSASWKRVYGYIKHLEKGDRILHLGAGSGREMLVSRAHGLEAYGITIGNLNIHFARDILGLGDYIKEGCCEAIPFPDESVRMVLGCQILEHAIAPILLLKEQFRLLVPGGFITLEWPAASSHCAHGTDQKHLVCYTPGQAYGLLIKAGFYAVDLFYSDGKRIPPDCFWKGQRKQGYVVAKARKPERL